MKALRKQPAIAAVFLAVCLLTACDHNTIAEPVPSAPADSVSGAYITMVTQYYDTLGNILEIPYICGDDNDTVKGINTEITALKDTWISALAEPYEHIDSQITAYPTITERYLNIVLLTDPGGYGNDGDVYTWTYDKQEQRQVTLEEAFSIAGITEDDIRFAVQTEMAGETPYSFSLKALEIAGFRIGSEGSADFYIQATTADQALPDDGGFLDSWRRLYIWSDGTLTRYESYPGSESFRPLVPTGEIALQDPPLWCQWFSDGKEPQGGFTVPPLPAGAAQFQEELGPLILELYSLPEDTALAFTYLGAWEAVNGQYCWGFSVSPGEQSKVSDSGAENNLGNFYQNVDSGEIYMRRTSDQNMNYYEDLRICRDDGGRLFTQPLE